MMVFSQHMVNLIVIVDDNALNRRLAAVNLGRLGWQVTEFAAGAGVVDYVRAHKPAGVLLDIELPDISGVAICREIRRRCRGYASKIVAYTASDNTDHFIETGDQAFNEILHKPVLFEHFKVAFGIPGQARR